jgi:hypothetical protein
MAIGLLLFYGGMLQEALDPVLAASSIGVLAGAILMGYLVVRFPRAQSA